MWVEFVFENTPEGPTVRSCSVGDEVFHIDGDFDQGHLLQFLTDKLDTEISTVAEKGSAKVNMKVDDFDRLVRRPLERPQSSTTERRGGPDMAAMLALFERQQAQMNMQQQMLLNLVRTMGLSGNRPGAMVRPDDFDGTTSPDSWMSFFEHACQRNGWLTDDDKIDNLRLSLGGCARKWYDTRHAANRQASWQSWKDNFLVSFGEDYVGRWDDAITHKYAGGPLVEYYFEKLRLLQLAEPNLPERSVVALLLHGLPTHTQQMVKIRGARDPEALLQCLREIR